MRLFTGSAILLLAAITATGQTGWIDPSPHLQRFVAAGPDARLEVLDWGGSGRTLVLLAQLGQTAHIYDDWAPTLTSLYRVIGVTRRGYGESGAAPGYSAQELGNDILRVLDAERLSRPVLVGNGFAGEEMTWIAQRYPDRLAGLVYLNAAYDRTNIAAEGALTRRIPQSSPPRPEDMASIDALARWASRGSGVPTPQSEFRQIAQVGADGRVIGQRTGPAVQQQILAGMVPHDYTAIQVPVLATYPVPASADAYPGCSPATDPAVIQACAELYAWTLQQLDRSKAMVRTIPARTEVVDIPGAHAFVFLSHPADVRRALGQFMVRLAP